MDGVDFQRSPFDPHGLGYLLNALHTSSRAYWWSLEPIWTKWDPWGASTWLRKNVTESTKNDQKCEVKLLASWAHPGSKLAPNFTSMHSRMYAKHLEGVLVHGDRMGTSGSQPSPFIVMWVWPRNTDQKHIKTWKNVKKKSPPPPNRAAIDSTHRDTSLAPMNSPSEKF